MNNKSTGVDIVLDELYEMIQGAKNIPLMGDKCIVEREAVLDILDDVIASLPNDIKRARTIINSRNELIISQFQFWLVTAR